MKNRKGLKAAAALLLLAGFCLLLWLPAACTKTDPPPPASQPTSSSSGTAPPEPTPTKETETTPGTDPLPPFDASLAEYMSLENGSLYFANLRAFPEFATQAYGYINEGGANLTSDGTSLEFHVTVATGSVTGALDGPRVFFRMDLESGDILERVFSPAPDYEELGLSEFAPYSGMILEINDERLTQIGLAVKGFILANP